MTRRVFWWSWGVFTLLATVWAVANPLMAAPDEPAHVVQAAAVVRGQLLGPAGPGGTVVDLPYFYERVGAYPTCYMFHDDVTGNCDPPATKPLDAPSQTSTPAGRYNPLYYAIVGLPTLAPPGDGVLYAMRILSGALTGFFLALGMRAIAELRAPSMLVPAVAAAITPMVVFLDSSVNPAALEIAAAFALWAQLLTLLRHPDPARDVRRMWWIALSAVFFANARGLSLLWAAVVVVVCVVASSWARVRDLLVSRRAWPAWAVVAAGVLAAAAWLVGANSLSAGGASSGVTVAQALVNSVLSTNAYLLNMVGEFGWLDTFLEHWVYMTWALLLGVVLLPALAAARRRELWAQLLLGASVLALPVLVHSWQAPTFGIIWQGRYVLPVAVGLPLLAGYVLHDRAAGLPHRVVARLGVVVAVVACLVQGAAFVENLHRYVNGEKGAWAQLEPDAWLPPLPLPLVLALAAVAVAAYGALLVGVARIDPHRAGAVAEPQVEAETAAR